MEVPTEGERRTCETDALDLAVGVWLPSQGNESCVHHQAADLSSLLQVWKGIWLFLGIDASRTIECCGQDLCATRSRRISRNRRNLSPSGHRHNNTNSSQVSYLAQTRKCTPVILYCAECDKRATSANSQLSFLGRGGQGPNRFPSTTSSRLAFVIRVYAVEPPADTIRP